MTTLSGWVRSLFFKSSVSAGTPTPTYAHTQLQLTTKLPAGSQNYEATLYYSKNGETDFTVDFHSA